MVCVSRFLTRNDAEAKGKKKAFCGGFAAAKRSLLSHEARHVERSETSFSKSLQVNYFVCLNGYGLPKR